MRLLIVVATMSFSLSCGGGDKHLPSSNPPEYDPKKTYTAPAAPPSASATVAKPTEVELLRSKIVIAPKAKRCPDPEGMVEGKFEWFLVMYRATMGPDGAQGVLYRRKVVAELKGKVGDDAKVQYVGFDATVTLQHIGTELPPYSHTYGSKGQFTIDQRMMGLPEEFKNNTLSDFSAGEAEAKDAQLIASLTLLVAYFSGLTYFDAQTEWHKPNTCVEITFEPATKTKKLGRTSRLR